MIVSPHRVSVSLKKHAAMPLLSSARPLWPPEEAGTEVAEAAVREPGVFLVLVLYT